MWEDRRIGGFPRFYLEKPEGADLRIDTMLLRSVVFLAVRNDETEEPVFGGTGCIVSIPSRAPGHHFQILVTAGHCVEGMRQWGHSYIRVNTPGDGDARLLELGDNAPWEFAPDYPATDLAACPLNLSVREFDIAFLPFGMAAFPPVVESESIGIGDELYVVGLFTRRHGKSRNLPIVRTGTIAAMPLEPVDNPATGVPYHAYLAEIRSIGGLSGSPVFVDIRPGRVVEDSNLPGGATAQDFTRRSIYLLGVVRGRWNKEAYEMGDFAEESGNLLNTGIATVTPIDRLADIVATPAWAEKREAVERKLLEKLAATEDSATGETEYERFTDMLGKLVQVPKDELDEKRREDA